MAGRRTDQGVATRGLALQALVEIDERRAWAAPVVDRLLGGSGLDRRDRRFAANLAYSTLRFEGTLDWALSHVLDRPSDRVDAGVRQALRMGAWELLYGAAPARAVVAATVEAVRSVVGARPTGFVNGVLRGLDRIRAELPWPDPQTVLGLALRSGYPTWIVHAARRRFDDAAPAVLEAGNEPPGLTLRAVGDREALIAELVDEGHDVVPGALTPDAVRIPGGAAVTELACVAEGRAVVQDEASMALVRAAVDGLDHGARAVDVCAAPGGKATHLAQLGLQVVAGDRHAGRLRRAAALARRIGVPLETRVHDATATGLPDDSADLVLVDAPCSGLGVVRRRPELRWRQDPDGLPGLVALQRAMVAEALRIARPGGRVVYGVCTWTVDETDEVIGDLRRDDVRIGSGAEPDGTPGTLLRPDTDGTDGMFWAVLNVGG